jgi:uncharacterized protein YbcI
VLTWVTGARLDLRPLSLPGEAHRAVRKQDAVTARDHTEQELLAGITRDLVSLHHEYYGKGPTRARSYMADDTLISILEGGFTTVEATLIADGKSNAVHEIRRSFQTAMEERFRAVVEGATNRSVIAYMSQIHTDPDMAVELFVLEPVAEGVGAERDPALAADKEGSRVTN